MSYRNEMYTFWVHSTTTAIDIESSSTFTDIYHDILVTAVPPMDNNKGLLFHRDLAGLIETWWLGKNQIYYHPPLGYVRWQKNPLSKSTSKKRVRERFIFHTDTENLLKGVFKQSLFITEFYKKFPIVQCLCIVGGKISFRLSARLLQTQSTL